MAEIEAIRTNGKVKYVKASGHGGRHRTLIGFFPAYMFVDEWYLSAGNPMTPLVETVETVLATMQLMMQ